MKCAALLVLVLALAGCPGGGPPPADVPPDVRYGVDACARCQMIVNEERFAAAYVTPAGEVRAFDDLGCLARQRHDAPEAAAAVWVHDDASRAWVRAEAARFARTERLITPMASGIVAARDEVAARAIVAASGGEVLDLDGLLAWGRAAR